MTKDESLALYHAGPKVVVKILCDLSLTIESQRNQIEALEIKIAKLSKNSSNSSKRPSSDDITKSKTQNPKGQEKGARKIGGQPGHERHSRVPFTASEIDKTHPYILSACPECNGEVSMLDMPPRIIQQLELVEMPIIKEEHRSYPVWCDKCQKIHYMPFPVNVVKEGLFKERLTATVAYMKNGICSHIHFKLEEETLLPYFFDITDYQSIKNEKLKEHIDRVGKIIYGIDDGKLKEGDSKLPGRWVESNLALLTTKIGSGATPRGGKENYIDKGISLIRSQNVLDFSFSKKGLAHITDEQAEDFRNVTIEKNDILLNITGDSVARVCLTPRDILPARVNQHVAIIRCDNTKINYQYLLYYLLNPYHKSLLLKIASDGGTRKALTKLDIESLTIQHPVTIGGQKKIAKILSCLDLKIKNLQKQNQTLEKIAQSLFKQWFVDFNFPDENGKPYKDNGGEMVGSELGEIPKGWCVDVLGHEFEILMGQSPAGKSYNENQEGMVFFQGRTDFGFRHPKVRLYTSAPKRIAETFDVLVSVRAPVGDINVASDKCCIGRGLSAVKNEYKSYCLYKLKSLAVLFKIFEKEGTVFGALNKETFNNIDVIVPNDFIKKLFEAIGATIDQKILNNTMEIQTLTKTRDTLLPKLMSGQIRVSD